jgi:uncharacterized protein (TIGR00730 family)
MDDHPVKAYKNLDFLNSPPARPIRILAEYLEPGRRFRSEGVDNTIVFFGSARAPSRQAALQSLTEAKDETSREAAKKVERLARYYEEARDLAARLTRWSDARGPEDSHFVVTTGGGPGIMEAANLGAHEAGGQSAGLGISLPWEPALNRYVSEKLAFEFHYFFMRKYWFAYLAEAVVAFPGGLGTLDEVLEVLTLLQTKKINKPMPIVLYGVDFWTSVLKVDALERWGTISREDLRRFHLSDDVDDAYGFLVTTLEQLPRR